MKRHRKPTIAITYAWSHHTTGDMAIVLGLVRLLQQALPEVTPLVYTVESAPDHGRTARYLHGLEPHLKVYPDPFSPLVAGKTPEQRAWKFQAQLTSSDPLPVVTGPAAAGLKAWADADLRLFNSSMQLSHRQDGKQFRYWLPNAVARRLSLPYALWSQSFGRIDYPGVEMLRHFLGDSLLLTNRDRYSEKLIRSLGFTKPILGYTSEPILFFDYSDQAWGDQFLAQHDLERDRFLVVLPRTYEFWGEETPAKVLDARMSKLAHAINRWVETTRQKVLITYELPREVARIRTKLWPHLSTLARRQAVIFGQPWKTEQAMAVFERAHAMLSMERYTVYLGLTAGIPVLHPTSNAISLRMDVLDQMKLGRYHVSIDKCSPAELADRLLSFTQGREKLVSHIATERKKLARESVEMMCRLWSRVPARQPAR